VRIFRYSSSSPPDLSTLQAMLAQPKNQSGGRYTERPPDADEVEHRYQSRIAEVDRAVLVAVNGATVVGFADESLQRHEGGGTYHRPGIDVYVEELIVTASQRRRGVATALMQAIETWGRNAQARMIWLDTHLANDGARALYGAIGYREIGVELMKEL
jgi:GNAT superfamily N-acetyltransferase